MVSRKVPKEVLQIFDKYVINNVRNLSKEKSIEMLQNEFQLTTEQAEQMFETFDQDQNGKMSVWEFQQFYACVGANAQAWVQKFIEIDVDKSGHLDMEEARAGMSEFKTDSGHEMSSKEIEFFLKNAADENGTQKWIQKFIELDSDKNGHLNLEEARTGMNQFKTESGHEMTPKEIDFFLTNAVNDNGEIDLGKFVALLSRLRVYKGQAQR